MQLDPDPSCAPGRDRWDLVRAEVAFAGVALSNGDPRAARDRLRTVDAVALPAALRAEAMGLLADAYEALGDRLAALFIQEALLSEALSGSDPDVVARWALAVLTNYLEGGDLGEALACGRSALTHVTSHGGQGSDEHLRLASSVLWVLYEVGDLTTAAELGEELIELARASGSRRGAGSVYWNVALVAAARADRARAVQAASWAVACLGEDPDSRDLPRVRTLYAYVLLLQGGQQNAATALEQLLHARTALDAVGSPVDRARARVEQVHALLALGRPNEAWAPAREAVALLAADISPTQAMAHLVLGDVHLAVGSHEGAAQEYTAAVETLKLAAPRRSAAEVWVSVADRFERLGDLSAALHAWRAAGATNKLTPRSGPSGLVGHVQHSQAAVSTSSAG